MAQRMRKVRNPNEPALLFGKWIYQYRCIHGLTQPQLAEITGVSRSRIQSYERGKKMPSGYRCFIRLAQVMGLTLDTLSKSLDDEGVSHVASGDITTLSARSHKISTEKEWWADYQAAPGRYKPYVLATKIALIASEISEALEEARKNAYQKYEKDGKPEGVVVELADAIIRIFDFCEHLGLDLKGALLDKLTFNETRPVKHGKVF